MLPCVYGARCRFVPVSKAATTKHDSSWSACAQDVAWGNIDFCIGNTWATEARLDIVSEGAASLLTATYNDEFKLLVPTDMGQTTYEDIPMDFFVVPFSGWYRIAQIITSLPFLVSKRRNVWI